jgi:hypothetical protein
MNIACASMWYGDASKHLRTRVDRLLAIQGVNRWIWVVKKRPDCTEWMLDTLAAESGKDITILIEPPRTGTRLERLSAAGDLALAEVNDGDDLLLWHESDLLTMPDVALRLAEAGKPVIGGWPMLSHNDEYPELTLGGARTAEPLFYDTWGYRAGGQLFANHPPYHECYTAGEVFQLDSVGSVVMVEADYIRRGARFVNYGLVELCRQIRQMGGSVWCDPRVPVVQPVELWNFEEHE